MGPIQAMKGSGWS